jgi:3-hydroxybutyrate dehydrogenase
MSPGIAFVTGAGSGIGRGLAQRLAAQGFAVATTDLDGAAASATVEIIRKAGGTATPHVVDVTDYATIERALGELQQPVSLLVNNAGFQHVAPLETFGMERFARMIDVMLTGAARCCAAVLPGMRAAGFGRIVTIGSIHSLVASPYKSAYVAAKHGLVGFTRTLALETADTDITANLICPAYVRTPLVDTQVAAQAATRGIPPEAVIDDIMLRPMPKHRFVEIDEIAATIAFLASAAARNITGQAIAIDGGWTAQ